MWPSVGVQERDLPHMGTVKRSLLEGSWVFLTPSRSLLKTCLEDLGDLGGLLSTVTSGVYWGYKYPEPPSRQCM